MVILPYWVKIFNRLTQIFLENDSFSGLNLPWFCDQILTTTLFRNNFRLCRVWETQRRPATRTGSRRRCWLYFEPFSETDLRTFLRNLLLTFANDRPNTITVRDEWNFERWCSLFKVPMGLSSLSNEIFDIRWNN
jgi:hypothetical protein